MSFGRLVPSSWSSSSEPGVRTTSLRIRLGGVLGSHVEGIRDEIILACIVANGSAPTELHGQRTGRERAANGLQFTLEIFPYIWGRRIIILQWDRRVHIIRFTSNNVSGILHFAKSAKKLSPFCAMHFHETFTASPVPFVPVQSNGQTHSLGSHGSLNTVCTRGTLNTQLYLLLNGHCQREDPNSLVQLPNLWISSLPTDF